MSRRMSLANSERLHADEGLILLLNNINNYYSYPFLNFKGIKFIIF